MLGTEPAHNLLYGRLAHCSVACMLRLFQSMPCLAEAQACCTAGAGAQQPTCVLIQLLHCRPQLEADRFAQSLQQGSRSGWQPSAGGLPHTWAAVQAAGMPEERAPHPPDGSGRLPTKRKLGLMPADEQQGNVHGHMQHQSSLDGTQAQQWEQVSVVFS